MRLFLSPTFIVVALVAYVIVVGLWYLMRASNTTIHHRPEPTNPSLAPHCAYCGNALPQNDVPCLGCGAPNPYATNRTLWAMDSGDVERLIEKVPR